MHVDAQSIPNLSRLEGDICIVGAGAAGITIALEFLNSPYKIILLESGGFEYEAQTQDLNQGYNVGLRYFPLKSARLRFFGGTSGHWAGLCAPLDAIDFEERPWVPYSGWPFSKKELDPFYKKAHLICELGPYNYDPHYWETKYPHSQCLPLDSTKIRTKIWQKSPPTRFGKKYKATIVEASNIHLYTHANLTQVKLNESARQVTDLEVKTLSGKTIQVKAKLYVMACGAIQNARYLLHSNAVMKKGLGNQNGMVGRFFMEHPHVDSADLILTSNQSMDMYFESFLSTNAFGMLALTPSYQRQYKLLNYAAQLMPSSLGAIRDHIINLITEDASGLLEYMDEMDREKRKGRRVKKPQTKVYIFNSRSEQSPNPDSRVELANTKDALGVQEVNLNWQLSSLDKKTILEANTVIGKALGKAGLGRLRIQEWELDEQTAWPNYLAGGWHHMGTTRMNNDPKKGVVDENCQLHGLPNLFIAGSSVFPTSGTANPTLTIVALAIRLADHIKKIMPQTK